MRQPAALRHEIVDQGGLADTGVAAQDQRPATTRPHLGQQLVQDRDLGAPTAESGPPGLRPVPKRSARGRDRQTNGSGHTC